MIGIGITTHNRPQMLSQCLDSFAKHTHEPVYTVVVDDGSAPVVQIERKGISFWRNINLIRHEDAQGVAAAKNACLQVLMDNPDVDHLFLFDDDTWPTDQDWWWAYVNSGVNHLSYNWFPKWDETRDCWPVGNEPYPLLTGWNTSNGCLLYYTRKAIEVAGGMRLNFGKWGFEHMEHSHRIHRMGLTPEPFISLSYQHGIYAHDEHQEQKDSPWSSITPAERREWYQRNMALYGYWIEKDPEFVPYDR